MKEIKLDPDTVEKSTFVIPFGLCTAPVNFQRLMDCVLLGLQWLSCLV